MAKKEAMMSVMYSFTVLALLTGFIADGSLVPKPEKLFSRLLRKE